MAIKEQQNNHEQGAIAQKSNRLNDWHYPKPLTPSSAPDTPYPIYALPAILQKAVSTYQLYGQQPLSLVACSALANISLSCQTLANVARDRYLISPVSLYFLSSGFSGERKSGLDSVFSNALREWEANFHQQREKEAQTALSLHHIWQMERDGLMSQIKRSASSEEDRDHLKIKLSELVEHEPEIPLIPSLYFEDTTHEALALHLANGWPSGSLWSDEAGIVLGSHSMQANPTRFVALLNRLWDGKPYTAHRKTSQSFTIKNRRLTLNLMMQPLLLQKMGFSVTSISRQSGFMARCLLTYPTTSMGKRFYKEPPSNMDCLTDYEQRLIDCLNQTKDLSQIGCVQIPTLWMTASAKKQWVKFFNGTEAGLLSNQGQWTEIKDFASKAAENVARLAALFHLFEGKMGEVSSEHVEQAIEIITWHMQETRRIFTSESTSATITGAQKLMQWLTKKGLAQITLRDVQRLSPLRDKKQRDEAIELLTDHHWVRQIKINGQTALEINPGLI